MRRSVRSALTMRSEGHCRPTSSWRMCCRPPSACHFYYPCICQSTNKAAWRALMTSSAEEVARKYRAVVPQPVAANASVGSKHAPQWIAALARQMRQVGYSCDDKAISRISDNARSMVETRVRALSRGIALLFRSLLREWISRCD